MYTISQVDVSYLMDKAYRNASDTKKLIHHFVFESIWFTSFFKQNAINPMEWQDDVELIERNQLVKAILNWFSELKNDDELAFWRPSARNVWDMIRESYTQLSPYVK